MGVNHEDIGVKDVTRFLSLARRAIGLVVLALMLLSTQPAGAVSYKSAKPRGTLGLSRPAISQQFYLSPGESIRSAQMLLDGKAVAPAWDAEGLVSYVPPEPLAEGVHTVRLSVQISSGIGGWEYAPVVSDFSFTVAQGAVAVLPQPGPEALRALERVNAYRTAARQSPLKYNNSLGAAAAGHARYLAQNPAQIDLNAHGQTAGTPLFFGTNPGERVQYYGYGGGAAEIINFTDRAEDAVDGWMATLYHRLPMIYPGNTEMGYGVAGTGPSLVNVLEAGPADAQGGAVFWPYDGQADVPTSWSGLESPDPFRLYAGVQGPVGYTITLTFGGTVRSLALDDWSLTGPSGPVAAMSFDPANDDLLRDTVALIPRAPLAPGAQYKVTMAGQVDVGQGPQPYTHSWSFTTAAEHAPRMDTMVKTTRGGVLTAVRVEGTGFAPGMRVYLGGLPVRRLEVTSSRTFSFAPPLGLDQSNHDLMVVSAGGKEARWPDFLKAGSVALPAGTPFTEMPMMVHGGVLPQPAKVHADGTVLIPAAALEALGAARVNVSGIGRTYWTWSGREGDYTLGHAAAQVDGRPYTLPLPAQQIDGETYVAMEWVSRLLNEPVRLVDGRAEIGLGDIGQHWARELIVRLVRDGVVSGVGAGQFRPEDPLTRAAFVKMLVGARHLAPRPGDAGRFADTGSHWVAAQGYIGAAVQAGFVVPAEYPGGLFLPDLPISREEIAVMVTRALGLDATARARTLDLSAGVATIDGRTFTDAADWTRAGYVAVAVEQGIINGYATDDGRFLYGPFRQATRAEAVAMIVRMPAN